MGMHTSVYDCDVEIVDMEGLKKFLKELKAGKNKDYIRTQKNWTDTGENIGKQFADAVKIDEKNNMLDFSGMDGWKIISYWYHTFVQFLRDVAIFVEGNVYLEFENSDEAGGIEFKGGKCIISAGVMQMNTYTPKQMRREIKPLSKELKKRLLARKI